MKRFLSYFSKLEITLWISSIALILISFLAFDRANYITLIASFIGVTSLIFNAKGNPFGQVLMIAFSLLYGIISYTFSYYGEMITYLGMTMPMAVFALISWLLNPYNGNRAEVKVNKLCRAEQIFMWLATLAITVIFLFHFRLFQYPKHLAEHAFGINELSGCVSYIPQKSLFCLGLCCKRHCAHCFMGIGKRF